MSTATEIVIIAFAITNGLRVLAYLPQIIRLARDETGAAAVRDGSTISDGAMSGISA
jgi:hypothetical protein